ncbi:MAG TPA: type II secretion system protein GspE [Desulfobacteraceae bacterium]|nr:type II secretion system protein GspE [Desulfobacteraceae bacterium]
MGHRLLGEILVELCGLEAEILASALAIQKTKGGRLGEILIRQNAISEEQLLQALAIQFSMPFVKEIAPEGLNTEFTDQVPILFLKKWRMFPVMNASGRFIAVNDPLLFQPLDDLRLIPGLEDVPPSLAPAHVINSLINYAYDLSRDSAEQVVKDMQDEDTDRIISEIEETGDLLEDTSDAPIVKLVNLMLSQAVKARASDIHIEPSHHALKIRYRVDGILYDKLSPPKRIQSALISRVKVMANMNIAEKRLPQDGRIEIRMAGRNIDIRVSTIPTSFGERVVLRLLDKTSVLLNVSDLGMPQPMHAHFDQLIRSAYGIMLVSGPTGSGKTTTLYAALSSINIPDINIITIEDPVEYQIDGIGQIQVNPKINLTFANGLRSIVRQDPDVILVGEIRDLETAEIATQSALTGHLVFSTLHTNDSASAVTRLIDMGIEPFLVTSSVIAILAQRLVRVICNECKVSFVPNEAEYRSIGLTPEMVEGKVFYRGTGCPSCMNTGYRGRSGIFEILMMTDEIKRTILSTSDAGAIKSQSVAQGMVTLREAGARKVLEGVTTIEEVFRVTQQ